MRNESDTLIRRVEAAYANQKKTLDKTAKKQIKSDLSYLKKLVSKIKPGDVTEEQAAELRRAKEALEASAGPILPQE